MLEISFCVLSNEVVRKPDIRVGSSVVLTTDCTSIMISSFLMVEEAFLQEALRFPDVSKTVVESTSTIGISLDQLYVKSASLT